MYTRTNLWDESGDAIMAERTNQRVKALYLMKILLEMTDENHILSMGDIIAELDKYQVSAERKSIYENMEDLRQFGLDIVNVKGKNGGYYIGSRDFELPELKLLVDAVQSSKFITEKKSLELIKKIENLGSRYEAQQLQRQVFVANRIKAMNESIYYNVDSLHAAMAKNVAISFQYWRWNIHKEPELTHNGKRYCVSPWGLSWDDENYYLVGYDHDAGKMKHFRVDKMKNITMTEEAREGKEHYSQIDMAKYSKQVFGMFSGEPESVKIRFTHNLVGVIIDRFGKNSIIQKVSNEYAEVRVDVVLSQPFYGWLFGLGNQVRLMEPAHGVEEMRRMAQEILSDDFLSD